MKLTTAKKEALEHSNNLLVFSYIRVLLSSFNLYEFLRNSLLILNVIFFQDYFVELNISEIKEYMKNLLIALKRVHEFDIIHRDIKPSNFLNNRQKRMSLLFFSYSCLCVTNAVFFSGMHSLILVWLILHRNLTRL